MRRSPQAVIRPRAGAFERPGIARRSGPLRLPTLGVDGTLSRLVAEASTHLLPRRDWPEIGRKYGFERRLVTQRKPSPGRVPRIEPPAQPGPTAGSPLSAIASVGSTTQVILPSAVCAWPPSFARRFALGGMNTSGERTLRKRRHRLDHPTPPLSRRIPAISVTHSGRRRRTTRIPGRQRSGRALTGLAEFGLSRG